MEYKKITVSDKDYTKVVRMAYAKISDFEDEGWVCEETDLWSDVEDKHYINLYFIKPKQKENESKENTMSKKSSKNIVVEWAKEIMNVAELAYDASDKYYKDEYLRQIIGSCRAIIISLDCCDDKDS